MRYDIYILRADLTRTALGTVPSNDGGGSHSISLGSWEAYQPLALSTPSPDPNWLGPAEPDTGFEVEDDSPRLPGLCLSGRAGRGGRLPQDRILGNGGDGHIDDSDRRRPATARQYHLQLPGRRGGAGGAVCPRGRACDDMGDAYLFDDVAMHHHRGAKDIGGTIEL